MKQSNYLNFKNHHIYVGFHSFPISRLGTSLDWERLSIGNVSRLGTSLDWERLPFGNVSRLGTSPVWERLSI